MTTLNWLHFSDLHQGMADQDWLWPNVRAALFEDLTKVSEQAGPWDLVLFTGDLTQKGSPAEFARLEETLGELWAHLAKLGSHPLLLAVPGNHDLMRPDKNDPCLAALDQWQSNPRVRESFWTHSAYLTLIREAFAPYQAFWDRAAQRPPTGVTPGHLPGDFAYVHEKEGWRIGFLGLNSAFLQLTDANFEKRLVVHPRQAQPAVERDLARWAEGCHAAFLMTHHPPSWLSDDALAALDGEISPPGRFIGHLFGHMHESYAGSMAEGGDLPRRFWQATSLCGLEWYGTKRERRHGYTAGRIELGRSSASLRLWPRRAEKGHSRAHHFGPDTAFRLREDVAHVQEAQVLSVRGTVPAARDPRPFPLPAPRHPPRPTTHPWGEAALATRLWDLVPPGPDAERWRTAVEQIVEECRIAWDSSIAALDDPWRDEDIPSRVLRMLELLLVDTRVALHQPEVALAVAAPFLREAAHAAGGAWMAEANPLSLAVKGDSIGARAILEREHAARAPLVRRANRLAAEGREEERRAIALWMMHHCLARDPALWEHAPHGHLPTSLQDRIDAVRKLSPAVHSAFGWRRLRELARSIFADPARIDRDDTEDHLHEEDPIADAGSVREKMLGYVLCLAGWMAMDARRLDHVLIGHVGLADPLLPEEVLRVLRDARWFAPRDTLSLTVTCRHPAIDVALHTDVRRAAAVLDRIREGVAAKRARLDALTALPVRLDANGVHPAIDADGHAAYQPQHIRFELAHDEVKELLMGKQLYGEPELAIRELYQNALDACRYREARRTYLSRTGAPRLHPWEGEIQFRQGDEGGRPYLECEDNGVGMGLGELEGCFAKAGRRFQDMPEFLEEQTQWLRVKPPVHVYPNSQFGIGVFSYFMLADEIEVETCRFNRDGSLGPVIRAYVSGSGGLFRIQVGPRGTEAGTRVRLYLDRPKDKRGELSCVKVLNKILHVAEYRTSAAEPKLHATWSPGDLRLESSIRLLQLQVDLWVTDSGGILLSDGIKTGDEIPYLIVNLRGPRRPHLTVDRKTVIEWDKTWLYEALRQHWARLAEWSHLRLEMLWWLESNLPAITVKIARHLGAPASLSAALPKRQHVNLMQVGCFALDQQILSWAMDDEWNESDKDEELEDLIEDELGFMSRGVAIALVQERVSTWNAIGARIHHRAVEMLANEHVPAIATRCVPEVGDWFVISSSEGEPAGLIAGALRLGERLEQVLNRLTKYEPLGFSIPSIDRATAVALDWAPIDVTFLSRDLDGITPWISGSAPPIHALKAMETFEESAEQILERYERYRCLGIRAPSVSPDQLVAAAPADEREWFFLTGKVDPDIMGVAPEISVQGFIQRAAKAKLPLALALNRIRSLGLHGPSLDFEPAVDYVLEEIDYVELGLFAYSAGELNLGGFLAVTLPPEISPDVRKRRLTLARRVGLVPVTCPDDVFADLRVDEVDLRILSRDVDGSTPWMPRGIPSTHVRTAAKKLRLKISAIEGRLRRLAPLGVQIVDVVEDDDRNRR